MWYRFEKGTPIGIPRIKCYQVAFYDMLAEGRCFDESWWEPEDIGHVIAYVETVEDRRNADRRRVFAHFDDGDIYELKLVKQSKRDLRHGGCFYGADISSKMQLKKWYWKKRERFNDWCCNVEREFQHIMYVLKKRMGLK